MNNRRKKWLKIGGGAILVLLLLYLFRMSILQSIGHYLIEETPVHRADAIVVLGGSSLDRSIFGARLYHDHHADRIVCTGGNIPSVLTALDTSLYEAQISKQILMDQGVPRHDIDTLCASTSTLEESVEVLNYALDRKWDTLIIVSSKFHLRRVKNVFETACDESEITLCFQGAPSSRYDEEQWWQSEEGMIMVNNEYMKLLYYFFKY